MIIQSKKTVSILIALLILTLALTDIQISNAGGGDVAMEELWVQAEGTSVDTNGDGRPETFSADYIIYSDGTAEGYIELDIDNRFNIEKGIFDIDENGNLTVDVQGTNAQHEVGHWLGLHTSSIQSNGTLPGPCPCDFILVDIVGASTNSFGVSVMISVR